MIGFTIALIVALIIVIILGVVAIWNGSEGLGIFSGICIIILSIILVFQISEVVGSENKAKFYNTTFKTNYTAEDVFWNNDAIKNQLLGEKKNINLNTNK